MCSCVCTWVYIYIYTYDSDTNSALACYLTGDNHIHVCMYICSNTNLALLMPACHQPGISTRWHFVGLLSYRRQLGDARPLSSYGFPMGWPSYLWSIFCACSSVTTVFLCF